MPKEPVLRAERVYNLGDYKSFRAVVMESDLDHSDRVRKMVDIITDQKEMFCIHQMMEADMYGREEDALKWRERIDEVNELRERYKEGLTDE